MLDHGPALVFLTGRGNTAHVFDDFAPEFTPAYHVYSVTRRGYGSSSWPEQGYDTATLSTDVVRVLDSQGIAKAVSRMSTPGPSAKTVPESVGHPTPRSRRGLKGHPKRGCPEVKSIVPGADIL